MAMPAQPPAWDHGPAGVQEDFEHRARRKFKNDVWLANYYINVAANPALAAQYIQALLGGAGRLAPGWLSAAQIQALNVFRAAYPNNQMVYGMAIAQLNNDLMANRTVY